MIIISTHGHKELDLGKIEPTYCEFCKQERPFRGQLTYGIFGFFWVFLMVTSKKYWLICQSCGERYRAGPQEVASLRPLAQIPFMDRFGLLVLGGVPAALFAGFCLLVMIVAAISPSRRTKDGPGGDVVLNPDVPIRESGALVVDFQKDTEAAMKRYQNKEMVVYGEVEKVAGSRIRLASARSNYTECVMVSRRNLTDLKPKWGLAVRGKCTGIGEHAMCN